MKSHILHLVQLFVANQKDLDQTQEEKTDDYASPATNKKALDVLLGQEEMQCEEEQGVSLEEVAQYFAKKACC